jgi:hypothetical protein
MKKMMLLAAALGIFLCAGAGAQERFTVQSVAGNVEREVSPGRREAVKAGDVLTVDTAIRTRLNSGLVVRAGERAAEIGAMRRGVLSELLSGGSAAGVRIAGTVTETDTGRGSGAGGASSTAAARASDAAAELVLLEE